MWIRFIGKKHSWKHLSLIGDEFVISFHRAKDYVFSDSVLCLGTSHQHPQSNDSWKERIGWIITDKSYRNYDGRPNSSGTSSQDLLRCGFAEKSQIY